LKDIYFFLLQTIKTVCGIFSVSTIEKYFAIVPDTKYKEAVP
jgi:hypothetical protein